MKVILINPPSSRYSLSRAIPLGLCYLSTVSSKIAENVEIIDSMQINVLSCAEIIKYITDKYSFKDNIVFGFSINFLNLESYKEISTSLKKLYINSIFIVGGTYITQSKNFDANFWKDADILIKGAGERPLEEILIRYNNNDKDFSNIPNIIWKSKNSLFVYNNLDNNILLNHCENILPDRSLLINKTYGNSELSILTSRGCPGKCTYCVISGIYHGKWIKRTVDSIIDEAINAKKTQTYTVGFFVDDCFLTDKKRALELVDKWHKKVKLPFYFAARVIDIIKFSSEEMKFLHDCGCFRIEIGFESFSNSVLQRYGKGINAKQNEEAIRLVRNAKIDIHADIILWDYEVTLEELYTTLIELHNNRLFSTQHMLQKLVPMNGTYIEKYYRDLGILYYKDGIWDYNFKYNIISKLYCDVLEYKKRFYKRILLLERELENDRELTKDVYTNVKNKLNVERLHNISYEYLLEMLNNDTNYNVIELLEEAEQKLNMLKQ